MDKIKIKHHNFNNGKKSITIYSGTKEKFIQLYGSTVNNGIIDVELDGNFNKLQWKNCGGEMPKLIIKVRYHLDINKIEMLYQNKCGRYYTKEEINYFPIYAEI